MFGLSAIECFVIVVAVYAIVYWITPRKGAWFPMLLVVLLLSVLAYHVIPNESDDLSRYFTQLEYLKTYGHDYLDHCFEDNINNWDTYRVCAYYFYFISKLPTVHYMPAITIFIVYGLMFLIMYKAANHFNINKLYLFGGTMFFLSTYWYYDTLSGIRNGLCFAVIFACAYYHLVERKNIPLCYLGYVLACLTHSSGIMIVALVILTELTLNNSGKFMNFLLLFGVIGGGALVQFLATITDNKFVQSIAGQVENNAAAENIEMRILFFVNLTVLFVVGASVIYFSIYILNGEYSSDLKRFYKLSSIILFFMVGSIFNGLIFVRMARWLLPIIGGMFFMIGMQLQSNKFAQDTKSYTYYYAPLNETIRAKAKPIYSLLFSIYTAVHLWYLVFGSSITWMHF